MGVRISKYSACFGCLQAAHRANSSRCQHCSIPKISCHPFHRWSISGSAVEHTPSRRSPSSCHSSEWAHVCLHSPWIHRAWATCDRPPSWPHMFLLQGMWFRGRWCLFSRWGRWWLVHGSGLWRIHQLDPCPKNASHVPWIPKKAESGYPKTS